MPLVGIPAELTGGDIASGMGGAVYYFATLLPHQVGTRPRGAGRRPRSCWTIPRALPSVVLGHAPRS